MTFKINIADEMNPRALIEPNYGNSYPRQMPIHLYIDPEDRTVYVDTNDFSQTGTPGDIWHNRRFYYNLPYNVDASELKEWIETDQELIGGIDKLIESYECHWNGNNYVGRYDEDVEMKLGFYIENHAPTVEFGGLSTPGDWFGNAMAWSKDGSSVKIDGCAPITADTTDEELDALAQELMDAAESEGVVFDGSVIDFLRTLREELE